jgi:hypothetical protein
MRVGQKRHMEFYLVTVTYPTGFWYVYWCGYLYKSGFDKVLGPINEVFVYIPE